MFGSHSVYTVHSIWENQVPQGRGAREGPKVPGDAFLWFLGLESSSEISNLWFASGEAPGHCLNTAHSIWESLIPHGRWARAEDPKFPGDVFLWLVLLEPSSE